MTDKESHMMHMYMKFPTLLEISQMSSVATTTVTAYLLV